MPGQTSDWGPTGFVFSISERSAGTSWLPPAQQVAAEAAEAAPHGPLRAAALAAEVAAQLFAAAAVEALASLPAEPDEAAVETLASPPAEPDAAAVAAAGVRPGVEARFAWRQAEWASQALTRSVSAAEVVAVKPHWAFVPCPELPA
jgi:hypothetical protein